MMKFLTLLSLVFLMSISVNTVAQTYSEFIVIDEIAENVDELKALNKGKSNVYYTQGIETEAITQISEALQVTPVSVLHIHAATKPGAIVFNSIALTPRNVDQFSKELQVWKMYVMEKVSIHSNVVFDGEEGQQLKQKLEAITGLVFESVSL